MYVCGITRLGENLKNKSDTITFTRFKLGNGENVNLTEGDIYGMVDLIQDINQPVKIRDIKLDQSKHKATVEGSLYTDSIKQGFFWRECGLYAMDPQAGEILYCYAMSSQADFIAPADSGMMEEILVSMVATVGSNTNVDVTIDDSMVFATKKYINTMFENTHKSEYIIECEKFGINQNGANATETLDGINRAISYAKLKGYNNIFLPAGTYLLDVLDSRYIHIPSDTNFRMDRKTVLKVKPCKGDYYVVLSCYIGDENITIEGGVVHGDFDDHDYTNAEGELTESLHALISITGSTNVIVKNVEVMKSAGMGIHVGNSGPQNDNQTYCNNITIENCFIHDIHHCGLTVSGGKNITIQNNVIKNVRANQHNITPGNIEMGMDVEHSGYRCKGITIRGNSFESNKNYDLQIFSTHAEISHANIYDNICPRGMFIQAHSELCKYININNNIIYNEKSYAISGSDWFGCALYVSGKNISFSNNNVKGHAYIGNWKTLKDCVFTNNFFEGFLQITNAQNIVFDGLYFKKTIEEPQSFYVGGAISLSLKNLNVIDDSLHVSATTGCILIDGVEFTNSNVCNILNIYGGSALFKLSLKNLKIFNQGLVGKQKIQLSKFIDIEIDNASIKNVDIAVGNDSLCIIKNSYVSDGTITTNTTNSRSAILNNVFKGVSLSTNESDIQQNNSIF